MQDRLLFQWNVSAVTPAKLIRTAALAYSHKLLDGCEGIRLIDRVRGYPDHARRPPGEWLGELRRQGTIGGGFVVWETARNIVQNLRTPVYSRGPGLCQQRDEHAERSARPYFGIAWVAEADAGHGRFEARAVDFGAEVDARIAWFMAGVPVLWAGVVSPLDTLITEVADFCHLFELHVSEFRGKDREHVARYEELARAFFELRHATADAASAGLLPLVDGLERESAYLHHAVGTNRDGDLVSVIAHGPLEHVGKLAREAGATHAIVVDNGGSVASGVQRPGAEPETLLQSYYFRPPSIGLLAVETTSTDPVHRPVDGTFERTTAAAPARA